VAAAPSRRGSGSLLRVDLEGSRALVTGATGGIGQAIARRLHERGATVLLSGRRADVLERLRAELGGERVELAPADLGDRDALAALPGRLGKVDVLVANAALQAGGALLTLDHAKIDRALDVNLRAPIILARELAPAMVERGYGHLVFISSLNGKAASPTASLYSAAKFGMRGFAQSLAQDLHGSGVGVTTVFPGFIRDAGMFHNSGAKLPNLVGTRRPEHVAKAVARGIERGRLEIDVAPFGQRIGARLAGLAPSLAANIQRRAGGQEISEAIARGHADER
jgi:short-subunit dehydrogenase